MPLWTMLCSEGMAAGCGSGASSRIFLLGASKKLKSVRGNLPRDCVLPRMRRVPSG